MTRRPSLAGPAFPGDDGSVEPRLATALAQFAHDHEIHVVLGALDGARLIVPVVALPGESTTGPDKEAGMAAVLMTGADGRKALLAFSSLEAMHRWDAHARPVSVHTAQAAQAALSDGASALVIDIADPDFAVIETDDVTHLSQGHRMVDTDLGPAWIS